MHSRIFQIQREPITEPISEFRYEECFVGQNGIDYVVKSDSKAEDINWLTIANKGLQVSQNADGSYEIVIVSKEEYFEKSFEEFQTYIEKFSNYTMEDFIKANNNFDFLYLKDAYNNEHGFYVDDNDEWAGIQTLDEWVRNAEENKTYYIGEVFDYHF